MEFLSVVVIAVGLAMDSFAVSIAGGVSLTQFRMKDALRTGFFMGVAQASFFAVGFLVASSVAHLIQQWDHWIALVLLSGVGLKMIYEHFNGGDDQLVDLKRKRILLTLAVATSIDALAVGVGFSVLEYDLLQVSLMIGLVSFLFSAFGVGFGARFSQMKSLPAMLVGGVLLVGIGVKIVVDHLVHNI